MCFMRICSFIFTFLNKNRRFFILLGGCIFYATVYGSEGTIKQAERKKTFSEPFKVLKPEAQKGSLLIKLQHAEPEPLVQMLARKSSGEGLLSKDGRIVMDKVTNMLWVYDVPESLKQVQRFIKHIDIPAKQIVLQAYIVNADHHFTRDLGVDFSGPSGNMQSAHTSANARRSYASIEKGKLSVAVSSLGYGVSLEMELSALEKQGRGRILSSPRLVTSSGKSAYIGSGDEIPYQEKTVRGNTSVAFKKAVLSLEVTPQWLSKNRMILDLVVHQDKVSALMVQGVPAIHTQEVRTQVRVKDGQTIVLGGIFEQVQNKQWEKVPVLGDIPLIGKLFWHQRNKRDRRELLIFITPRIIS